MNLVAKYLFIISLTLGFACSTKEKNSHSELDVAVAWAEMALYITQYTPANSPTYASRGFGYLGLTMYESVVHGYPSYQSLAGQLNGFHRIPTPEADAPYNWVLSLNAGQASILRNIYNQTSDENKLKIDSLELAIQGYFTDQVKDQQAVERSVAFGKTIAEAVFQWSQTDGGHRGYLKNFDKDMVHPDRPGSWKPPLYAQSFSHHPLHPYWGENRTFLAINAEIPTPIMIPYDTAETSPYFLQFLEVYDKDLVLTQEEKEAAIWWGDDPDVTFTPPGHSYHLATLAIKHNKPDLIKCTAVYAGVGIATADAFIACWKWKYHFFSERPNTFVPKFIDEQWESFWPDPPFPSFPSGHAIQAAAAATILENNFEPFTFIDSAHVGRERDELREVDFVPRSFDSFWEVAQETADSRFYGGIHTSQDNQVGLDEGVNIGQNVNKLHWKVDL